MQFTEIRPTDLTAQQAITLSDWPEIWTQASTLQEKRDGKTQQQNPSGEVVLTTEVTSVKFDTAVMLI